MKLKQEKKAMGSWNLFYDAILYANGILNEDFWGTFRGGITRKFCEIYESDLRPWKHIKEPTINKADKVSIRLLYLKIKLHFVMKANF
jgi:hypothetical protein